MSDPIPPAGGPVVTWLLPVRNGMPYLRETLASIESQTYPHWSVLAWDNDSTDGSQEELHRWIPERLPGRVITGCPLPLGPALAALVEQSETELCARIDADDVNLPDRLERQVAFLEAEADIAAVGTQIIRINEEGAEFGQYARRPTSHESILAYMLRGPGLAHPSVLFRRSCVLEVGNYRDVRFAEDYDLWMRLALKYRLANLAEPPLIAYRVHSNSTSVAAERRDLLRAATATCFAQHAPELYGLAAAEAELLASGRKACALGSLLRISHSLEHRRLLPALSRMGSREFRQAASHLIAPRDLATRLGLALLSRSPAAILAELQKIVNDTRLALSVRINRRLAGLRA